MPLKPPTVKHRVNQLISAVFVIALSSVLAHAYASSQAGKLAPIIQFILPEEDPTVPPEDPSFTLAPLFPENSKFTYIGAIRTPYGRYGKNTIEINKRYPNRLFLSGGGPNGDPRQTSVIELDISNLVNESVDSSNLNMATVVQNEVSIWSKIESNAQPNTAGYTVQDGGAPNGDHPIFNDMYYHKGATEVDDRLYTNYRVYYSSPGTEGILSIGSTPNDLANSTFSPLVKTEAGASAAGDVINMNSTWRSALGGKHLFIADHFVRLANGIKGGPTLATGDITQATAGVELAQTTKVAYTLYDPVWRDDSYTGNGIDWGKRDQTNFSGNNNRYTFLTQVRGGLTIGNYLYLFGSSAGNMMNVVNPRRFLDQATHEAINGSNDGRHPNSFFPPFIGTIDYKATDTLGHTHGGPNVYDAQDGYPWILRYKLSDIVNATNLYDSKPDLYGRFNVPFGRYNGIDGYTNPGGKGDGISGFAVDEEKRKIYLALSGVEEASDPYNPNPVIAVYSY